MVYTTFKEKHALMLLWTIDFNIFKKKLDLKQNANSIWSLRQCCCEQKPIRAFNFWRGSRASVLSRCL